MAENEVKEYKNLYDYIRSTNLGITFSATHVEYVATFERQYNVWSVAFKNENSDMRERAISPNNKLHEPNFTDLVYELCAASSVYNAHMIEPVSVIDDKCNLQLTRGKRFKDLRLDPKVLAQITSYAYDPKWKLWQSSFADS